MKFSCDKSSLQSAVNTALRAASVRNPLPVLDGLLITVGSDFVRITGYDLKKAIYTNISAEVFSEGKIVVNARLTDEIVRSMPDGQVTFERERDDICRLRCGNADFSIIGLDPDEYPDLPYIETQSSFELPQNTLKAMINETIFAVSNNESRPIYTGSLFEIAEGALTIVSVDGFRLAVRREGVETLGELQASFVVPGTSLGELERICRDTEENVSIVLDARHISFSFGDTVLISRRIEGEFMDYKKSIPTDFASNMLVERSNLSRSVERVSLIIDDRTKSPVHLLIGDSNLRLFCVTTLGKAEDICPTDGEGIETEIGFNHRYMLEALRAAPSEFLRIGFGTASSPIVITPEDGDNFLYMILPVRLKAEA